MSLLALTMGLTISSGCLAEDLDTIIYRALDYRIDTPRLLGLRVSPPVFAEGLPVTLDALFLGPGGTQAVGADWSTCSLNAPEPVSVDTLTCFESPEAVVRILNGPIPTTYTPPTLPATCDEVGSDSSVNACQHTLPLLVSSTFAGENTAGVSQTGWSTGPWPSDKEVPVSANTIPRSLRAEGDGATGLDVALTYVIDADVRNVVFHWYVDDGELLKTGQTIAQEFTPPTGPGQKGITTTTNVWTLPAKEGNYRVAVVWDGHEWGEASVFSMAPDQVWDVLSLRVAGN